MSVPKYFSADPLCAQQVTTSRLTVLCGWSIGIFFFLMFAIPSGYSYGASALLILSIWYVCSPTHRHERKVRTLEREDTLLAAVLFFYFAVAVASKLWYANSVDSLDQPLRAALAIPVLFMLLRQNYDVRWLWAGIALGGIACGLIGWRDVHVLGLDRAAGFLNAIHFGNIALIYAAFCASGLIWANLQSGVVRWPWRFAFLAGMVASLYSVVVGDSRGSWVALPLLVLLYCVAFCNRRNAKWAVGVVTAGVIAVAIVFTMPESRLKARYDLAVQDVQDYRNGIVATSVGARFVMWEGALKNFGERPFRGWNHEDYRESLKGMVERGELDPVALDFSDNLHNSYLHALLFQGVLGLIALLLMYFLPFVGFCRRLRHPNLVVRALAYCGAASSSAYVCFSLSQVILRRNNGIMFYVMAVVVFWSFMRVVERRERVGG